MYESDRNTQCLLTDYGMHFKRAPLDRVMMYNYPCTIIAWTDKLLFNFDELANYT